MPEDELSTDGHLANDLGTYLGAVAEQVDARVGDRRPARSGPSAPGGRAGGPGR